MPTATDIYDAYEARSWAALARRTREKGQEFVVGRRDGAYVWDLGGRRLERTSFGPMAASAVVARLRHFCTVVGLTP